MRITTLFIAAVLLASVSATVNSSITAFINRTNGNAFNVAWTVTSADATTCITGPSECCFNSGTLISTLTNFVVTIQGSATGTFCTSNSLTITITGTSDSSFAAGGLVGLSSTMVASSSIASQTLIFDDGSASATQYYKVKLQSSRSSYNVAVPNKISLPLAAATGSTSTSADVIAISLISFIALFL